MSIHSALMEIALREWTFFGKDLGRNDKLVDGKNKERVQPYCDRVGDYWLSISSTEYARLVKDYDPVRKKLDGETRLAWSAAFISYCMNMAGAGNKFPYSAGHVTWMVKAAKNRAANKLSAPLVAYRLGEKALKVGDLIARPRGGGASSVTYDNLATQGWFESHSDIVVGINLAEREAYVIGGNMGQSVGQATVKIDQKGSLIDPDGWIVHIENNI
ncbi:DUF2272 domain-containing protein [Rhizobium sp. CRIBSB]|nr:DUF2272 domain-containing protein [Rhizobium sp. CRIBSB]